jgi:hypothetical protein
MSNKLILFFIYLFSLILIIKSFNLNEKKLNEDNLFEDHLKNLKRQKRDYYGQTPQIENSLRNLNTILDAFTKWVPSLFFYFRVRVF